MITNWDKSKSANRDGNITINWDNNRADWDGKQGSKPGQQTREQLDKQEQT